MSVGPPAANGTMMVIGLLGKGWAFACGARDKMVAAQATRPIIKRWIMTLLRVTGFSARDLTGGDEAPSMT
jgi:hypothetical protein